MPAPSAAAETIAQKALHEKQETIPSQQKVPTGEKKGRGRPKGSTNQKPQIRSTLGGVADAGQSHNIAVDQERLAAATFIAGAVEVSGVAIGGKNAAMGEYEKIGMIAVWDKYLKSKGINDIPPSMALCLVMSQYYGRVLTTPEAQPKVKNFFQKVGGKIKRWKNARFGGGNDGERENDTGKATDKGLPEQGNKDASFRPA